MVNQSDEFLIEEVADKVVHELNANQISKWDLYLYDEQVNGIHFRKTEPELNFESHDLKYYIRIFEPLSDNLMGIGAVELNATNPLEIQKAIKRAQNITKSQQIPNYNLVSPKENLHYPSPEVIDKIVWNDPKAFIENQSIDLQQKLTEIMRAETTFGKFRAYKTQKMMVNSNGFRKIKNSTHFYYEFAFRARNDKQSQMAEYWTSGNVKKINQLKFGDLIPEWSTMAQDSLRATPPKDNNSIDVLFTPKLVRIALLETVGYAVTGQAQYSKTTPFTIGDHVADPRFTMVDNGVMEGGLHTSAWDSEGFPKRKTVIIENGIMKNFLYDQRFATLLNKESTGNAQRYPHKAGVMEVEINNLIVSPGNLSLKDIVANTSHMIYVNKFSWLRPNPITGDFGATILNGYMIENGKIGRPVRGLTISGNIYKMLHNIGEISKECRIVENAEVPFIKFKNLRLTSD